MPKTVYATGDIPTAVNFNAFTQEANAAITGGTIGAVTIDSTTNKPVTAASLAGGTLPASVTTLETSGVASVTDATDASNTTTASLKTAGGLAVAKKSYLGKSVVLGAGSAAAGTAPLYLTAGPLLTSVEPGALEYKGHTGYFTTYLVRRSIVLGQDKS